MPTFLGLPSRVCLWTHTTCHSAMYFRNYVSPRHGRRCWLNTWHRNEASQPSRLCHAAASRRSTTGKGSVSISTSPSPLPPPPPPLATTPITHYPSPLGLTGLGWKPLARIKGQRCNTLSVDRHGPFRTTQVGWSVSRQGGRTTIPPNHTRVTTTRSRSMDHRPPPTQPLLPFQRAGGQGGKREV